MNLKELKDNVDFSIQNLQSYENPEDVHVLITLSESSMGARASTGVSCACMGFDWEHGQFRIEPTLQLVRKGNNLSDIKTKKIEQIDGRKYYFCPRCGERVSKNDKYCRECGQRIE